MGMTISRLLSEMDTRELLAWRAYHAIEPWGEHRADYRAGVIAAVVANSASDGKRKPFTPEDMVPTARVRRPRKQSPEEMKQALMLFAEAHNANVIKGS